MRFSDGVGRANAGLHKWVRNKGAMNTYTVMDPRLVLSENVSETK